MKFVRSLVALIQFIPFYTWQLFYANLLVIRDVVTPRKYARPAVLKVPLRLNNPNAIFTLANLITMAPGTVCLDVSEDRRFMFIHVMFYDGNKIREDIRDLERRVGGLFNE